MTKKGHQKFWETNEKKKFLGFFVRETNVLPWASKNLILPGHPRTSACHWWNRKHTS